ncbi:MAG: nucleotide exchange factor GrpE, partial [Candidatus Hydrogenedentes bacterium]|nr:nucleotide exchange factor GrpE [Candidatus Hydrogenedentota bacterium]
RAERVDETEAPVEESLAEASLDETAPRFAASDSDTAQEAAPVAEETDAASAIEADFVALERERSELADQLLRARADFDNYRKRMARDAERIRQTAAEGLIRDILPVVDHLELALKHAEDHPGALGEGVAMVLKQFQDVLSRHGLEPIASVGEPFDPNVHEAVMQRESAEAPPESVVEEFQKGYRLGQMVLRPAKVVVSLGAPAASAPETSAEDGGDASA